MSIPFLADNEQGRIRLERLAQLHALTGNAYPNKFSRSTILQDSYGADTISGIVARYGPLAPPVAAGSTRPAPEDLAQANAALNPLTVRLAGRLATPPRHTAPRRRA